MKNGLFGLPRVPLQINRQIAFCLALEAGIAHGREPTLRLAIIFQAAIFNGQMKALTYIVKNDPRFFFARDRKPDIIDAAVGRHVGAPASISNIAEIAQFDFSRSEFLKSSAARSGKTRA